MILPNDVEFHKPPVDDPTWGETNFFGFYVPERRLCGSVYVVTRPQLGVTSAHVAFFDRLSLNRKECIYIDGRQHLPVPESLASYTLTNGLRVRSTLPPKNFELQYDGTDGTHLELTFEGLMDPFDINDGVSPAGDASGSHLRRTSYKGHFDLTAHVKGRLDIRGHSIAIDCIDTLDHSWGSKAENDKAMACWMHAHFGRDYVIHCILMLDPFLPPERQYTFLSGYVLKDGGVVVPLVEGQAQAVRLDMLGVGMRVLAVDSQGHRHVLSGTAVSATNIGWFPSKDVHYALHRWVDAIGRVGYGCVQEGIQLDTWCRRNALQTPVPA